MAFIDDILWWSMPPTALLSLLSSMAYLAFRIFCLVTAQRTIQDQQSKSSQALDPTRSNTPLALAWCFLCFECFLCAPNLIPLCVRVLALKRPKNRTLSDWSVVHEAHTVDVLITCCREAEEVILDTVRAACDLEYPAGSHRVFLCDDGASASLQSAIESLAMGFPNLHYVTRPKGPVKDYKAGNLNHGLKYSRETTRVLKLNSPPEHSMMTEKGSVTPPSLAAETECKVLTRSEEIGSQSSASEFVVGLDADMIPESHMLLALVPHLLEDTRMAMAASPQLFYDTPADDILSQSMSQCWGVAETVHDALGHADCLGSGYIMRRSALDSIGGFPTESLSEDLCCSAKLLGKGWKTCFVPQSLQYGSVPESFTGHVKQRTRWFVGHLQTASIFRFRLWGSAGKQLTSVQRIVGLAFDMRQVVQIILPLSYLSMPVALLAGYPFVIWTSLKQLKILIWLICANTLCTWLHQGVMGWIAGRITGHYDARIVSAEAEQEQWMSPYIFLAFVRSFLLPAPSGGKVTGFTSSGSIKSELHERDERNRAPLGRRLWVMLFHNLAIVHVAFVTACLTGATLTIYRACTHGSNYKLFGNHNGDELRSVLHARLIYLITRMGWPPLFWLQTTVSALVPILYTLWPPTTPERDDLLVRDRQTLVAHPVLQARKTKRTSTAALWYLRPSVAITYTLFLCSVAFWL